MWTKQYQLQAGTVSKVSSPAQKKMLKKTDPDLLCLNVTQAWADEKKNDTAIMFAGVLGLLVKEKRYHGQLVMLTFLASCFACCTFNDKEEIFIGATLKNFRIEFVSEFAQNLDKI